MSYWYVATPFTQYPHGHEAAYVLACQETARFAAARISVMSPIIQGWGLYKFGGLPAVDAEMWRRINRPLMEVAKGCLVVMADGWDISEGVAEEIAYFRSVNKQVRYSAVGAVPTGLGEGK